MLIPLAQLCAIHTQSCCRVKLKRTTRCGDWPTIALEESGYRQVAGWPGTGRLEWTLQRGSRLIQSGHPDWTGLSDSLTSPLCTNNLPWFEQRRFQVKKVLHASKLGALHDRVPGAANPHTRPTRAIRAAVLRTMTVWSCREVNLVAIPRCEVAGSRRAMTSTRSCGTLAAFGSPWIGDLSGLLNHSFRPAPNPILTAERSCTFQHCRR